MIAEHMLGPAIGASALLAGAGVCAWGAANPRSQVFGPTVRYTGNANKIALTFDDGPNPAITPQLLDLMERHGARATFFLIGRFVQECQAIANDIARRGHTIGNHTDTHANLFWLSSAGIGRELARCQGAIQESTRVAARWVRPPWGYRGPQLKGVVKQQGFAGVVMWSALAWDWKPQPPAQTIEKLRRVRGGDIVLLHDGDHRALNGDRRHVLAALEHWLPRWRGAGLEFATLDQIADR